MLLCGVGSRFLMKLFKKTINKKGLTLIEIIIALAIIGIIVTVFFSSFSAGFTTIIANGSKTKAMEEAQTIIDKIYQAGTPTAAYIQSISSGAVSKADYTELTSAYSSGDHMRFWISNKTIDGNSFNMVTLLIFYQNGRGYVTLVSLIP